MTIYLVCEEYHPDFKIHSAHSSDSLANKKKAELEDERVIMYALAGAGGGVEMSDAVNDARKEIAGTFFVMPLELDAE